MGSYISLFKSLLLSLLSVPSRHIHIEEERKSNLTVGDSLVMKVVVNYNGPKVSE